MQVPSQKTLPWYNGQTRIITRHELNDRRQEPVLTTYVKSVQEKGIVRGVRGDAWLVAPDNDKDEVQYRALTFATLPLG